MTETEATHQGENEIKLSPAMLNVYRIFVVCSVLLVYIGSVFMTYVILSDIIFQITHLCVCLTQMFETDQKNLTNLMKLIQQVCWVFYSFPVIAMIILVIEKQYVSFFSTMWDSLGTEQVLSKISGILKNPNINKRYVWASLILFALYFVLTVGAILMEYLFNNSTISYSAIFISLFFVPIVYGILKVIFEAWRIAFSVIRGDYSKYTFEPIDPCPNFPFPSDLLDPAKLREQNEFLNFIMDDRTNVYLMDGHTAKKLFGYLPIIALLLGVSLRIYTIVFSGDVAQYSGLIICAFYLYCAPFLVFCNISSTFLPDEAFSDEKVENVVETENLKNKRNFDKGILHLMLYLTNAIYVIIFICLIFISLLVVITERPEAKYNFKFYTNSSLMKAKWSLANASATTCSLDIKGMTFSQISAFPMLTYFGEDSDQDPEIKEHNRKVITNIALSTFKEGKVTLMDYDCLRQGIHIRNGKLHIFVINGLRRALDWVLLFEQVLQTYWLMLLQSLIPFYSMVYGFFRVAILITNKYFTIMTGCEFLTLQRAQEITQDIMEKCIPKQKSWPKYTNIAIGHMTGGYFAKYLGTFSLPDQPKITGIGFDSLSYFGTILEVENTIGLDFGMTLNVYSKGIYGASETKTKNNFERMKYSGMLPPDAVESFCQSVAMCSNNRYEIDFCHTILQDEFIDMMQRNDRHMEPDSREDYIGVITNKDDYVKSD